NFFLKCVNIAFGVENIILLVAHGGVKVLIPLLEILTRFSRKKLHYVVVGAWLPDLLEQNRYLIRYIKNIDYIYVQTNTLIKKLSGLSINSNTYIMPNFKTIEPVEIDLKKLEYRSPYKVCIVSRINYEKGIESAINVLG